MEELEGKLGETVKVEFRCQSARGEREEILIGTFIYSFLLLTGASRRSF